MNAKTAAAGLCAVLALSPAIARADGGIHFRFDQEAGAEQGRRLGAYVYRHNLSPGRSCPCLDEEDEK
jgi:hypothetical protein